MNEDSGPADFRAGLPMNPLANKAGQYLTFALGKEEYGIEILKVQEIIGMMPVTRVPQTPGFVRGAINLRGKAIPVMELRTRFALESKQDTERTCIIVIEIAWNNRRNTVGFLVDEVREVTEITEEQLEPTPGMGNAIDDAFIMAVAKVGGKVVKLLDADRILEGTDLSSVF